MTKKALGTVAILAALTTFTTSALAGPDGVWRCKASGNIPIALVTINGSAYEMQAVRDTVWTPKDNDSSNGSGEFAVDGNTLTPTSGPLADIYGAIGKYCNADNGECANEYLALDSTKGIPLGCWRNG